MGFEVALLVGVLAGGALIFSMWGNRPEQDEMQPQGLDSFGMTKNQEGQAVPWVRGKVRITSNLLWYGNLETEPVYQETAGKGIGGGDKPIQGYKYWLDLWHAICQGPNVTLNSVYIQDRARDLTELPVASYTFNPGDTTDYPTEPGAFACPMNPIAHLFLDRYLIGTNVTNVPTLHFVVTCTSDAPLTYANETNGVNPAAVIYDLLIEAEVPPAFINLASFEDAATYWHNKGYGLNIELDRQSEVKDHINTVLTYVDASLQDDGQQFFLTAYKDSDTAAVTITTDEFKEFTFARRSWDDVYTDFRANFTDETADFTQRTVRMRNSAARALIGHDRQQTVDLTAFRDVSTASARLWEIMKRLSYPEAQIKCTVSMKYAAYDVGAVVGITHSDYDLEDELYRIVRKEESTYDNNSIKLELVQVVEPLLDQSEDALESGGTHWTQTHYAAAAPVHQRVIELPYNSQYGETPAYLCLCERASVEDGFSIRKSVTSGGDFAAFSDASYFSQYGTLAADYGSGTYAIDDETGIRYTPNREDPVFSTISRASLFSAGRVAVLYDTATGAFEIVAFQTVTPIAQTSDVLLTGVIRGLLNTEVQSWSTGDEIWLVNLGDNVITGILDGQFYLKFVPFLYGEEVDESDCTEMTVNYAGRGKTPWVPSLVKASRSGSTVTVTVWPTTRLFAGAGVTDGAGSTYGSVAGQTDQWPPEFVGSFNYSDDGWTTSANSTSYTWNYSNAAGHTLRVKALVSGYQSIEAAVTVGASDGDYYGPTE